MWGKDLYSEVDEKKETFGMERRDANMEKRLMKMEKRLMDVEKRPMNLEKRPVQEIFGIDQNECFP